MNFFLTTRLPLLARILLWFLLNVAVLAAAFFLVLRWQFREGLHGAVGRIAEDRLQTTGQVLHAALSLAGRGQWTQVLRDAGARHGVRMFLLQPPTQVVAGDAAEIPEEVHDVMRALNPERGRGAGPPPGGPPPPPPEGDPVSELLFGAPLFPPDGPPPPPGGIDTAMPVRLGTFMLHAGEPPAYWAGVRLPPPPDWDRRGGPLMLVIVSPSMTGGGLFFDSRPWLIGIFGALAVSTLLWLPFVRGITRSIRATMQATEQIAQGRFEARVPADRGDELGRLAQAVNQMAAQLEGLVRGQKRFLGDIAHELCSPIARMEMSLGILEQKMGGEAAAGRLQDTREELRQISVLVNELMSFSKAALSHDLAPLEAVELLPLVDEAARIEAVPPEQLRLRVPAELRVTARPALLRRALGNILRNARLHAPASAVIEITAARTNGHVRLIIADDGPGVPADSLPRLFEPFYRVDDSRARETGGTGLGLAIVKTCVESCGGAVTARNRDPRGLELIIELPRA